MIKLIKNILRSFGVDIVRYSKSPIDIIQHILIENKIDFLIDGGANVE